MPNITTDKHTHTPGPWRFYLQGDSTRYIVTKSRVGAAGSSYDDVAHVDVKRTEEGEANARLIAAAPELLAALRAFVDGVQVGPETSYKDRERILAARAAIAKAVQP